MRTVFAPANPHGYCISQNRNSIKRHINSYTLMQFGRRNGRRLSNRNQSPTHVLSVVATFHDFYGCPPNSISTQHEN